MDAEAIAKAESGKCELSCGYQVDIDPTPGVAPDGQRYDVVQRKIRGNHVALVSTGRAGPSARLRLDNGDDVAFQVRADGVGQERRSMDLETLQKSYAAALERATAAEARADAAEKERDEQKARADKIESELLEKTNEVAAEKERADAAEKARTDAIESSKTEARARVELEQSVKPVLGEEYDFEGRTNRQVKVDAYEKLEGSRIDDDKSDGFVDGLFFEAMRRRDESENSHEEVRRGAAATKRDDSVEAARQDMIERERSAHIKKGDQ